MGTEQTSRESARAFLNFDSPLVDADRDRQPISDDDDPGHGSKLALPRPHLIASIYVGEFSARVDFNASDGGLFGKPHAVAIAPMKPDIDRQGEPIHLAAGSGDRQQNRHRNLTSILEGHGD